MRLKYLLLLVFSTFQMRGFSQDTTCITKVVDKFDGSVSYQFPGPPFQLNSETIMSIAADKGASAFSKQVFLTFQNKSVISVDDDSYVIFLFEDGTNQRIKNSGRYNTSGMFFIIYPDISVGGGKKMLQEVINKKIKGIRLSGFSRNIDVDLTDEISTDLQKALSCFYNGWKLHIKN